MVFVAYERLGVMVHAYLVIIHVLVVPVTLQPVLGSILLHKIVDSVSKVVGF